MVDLAPILTQHELGTRAVVAMTTWETSELAREYAIKLASYAAVIVPSEFCKERLRANGALHDDNVGVLVVPHTFDPDFWRWPNASSVLPPGRGTRFYSLGAWSERKNHEGVVRAFLHAFADTDEDVSLSIYGQGLEVLAVRSLLGRSAIVPQRLPNLNFEPATLTEQDLLNVHADNDVFVTATRGEGFGLPIFEAVAMGKMIITPGYGGHYEFLAHHEPDMVGFVDHIMTPCFAGRGVVTFNDGKLCERASLVPGMTCQQQWAEPDLVEMARLMRITASRRPGTPTPERLAHRRRRLEDQYAYARVSEQLSTILQEL